MAFDIGNGLSSAGTAVAATAGAYTLEAQKADLENQKIKLADDLAGKRESAGRQEQGLINATAADKLQTFQGGENEKNRTSEEKRTKMSSDASLGSAAISAAAHVQGANISGQASRDVANITGQFHLDASREYAKSRTDVADINAQTKKDVASAKAATGLDDDALDAAAIVYNSTGTMPSLGFGGANAKMTIMNRASELRKASGTSPEDWQTGMAGAAAAKPALAQLTKQSTMANAFSATAQKNGELLLSLTDKGVGPSGVPLIDRWIQAGRKNVAGDPDVTAFNIAMETFKTENAKVLSGATGAAGITDAAREHVDALLSKASTKEQIEAAVKTFEMERTNRVSSYQDQMEALQKRIAGGSGQVTNSPAATATNPTGAKAAAPTDGLTATGAPKMIPLMSDGKPDARSLVPGETYNTSRGPAKWNGTAFEPVR